MFFQQNKCFEFFIFLYLLIPFCRCWSVHCCPAVNWPYIYSPPLLSVLKRFILSSFKVSTPGCWRFVLRPHQSDSNPFINSVFSTSSFTPTTIQSSLTLPFRRSPACQLHPSANKAALLPPSWFDHSKHLFLLLQVAEDNSSS